MFFRSFLRNLFLLGIVFCFSFASFSISEAEAQEKPSGQEATASKAEVKGTILFVPQDNRPTSCEQSAEAASHLGYRVLMPPKPLLGGLEAGNAKALMKWTEEHISEADAAVLSTDSLIYGGLVASRKHELSDEELAGRVAAIRELKKAHPKLKLYGFGSLMRTPASGPASGGEEPAYYMDWGDKIFRRTSLYDLAEMQGLTSSQNAELQDLEQAIPLSVWNDWAGRRQKNFAVDKQLIDAVKDKTFDFFILGKDDNAPLSATHQESRKIRRYAAGIAPTHFQMLAGIDEFAQLLLTRAVNDLEHEVPFVNVQYNWGKAGKIIPDYSDETLEDTIKADLLIAGAVPVANPAKADFVLCVFTPPYGQMGSGDVNNEASVDRYDAADFIQLIKQNLQAGYKVAVADVVRTNGADNALMAGLRDAGLLFRLNGYAGWNTATNSIGFVLGQGILNARMKDTDVDRELLARYLDDWGYQSNVRTFVGSQLQTLPGNPYLYLGSYEGAVEARCSLLLRQFARKNLPPYPGVDHVSVYFPWHRMFIGGIDLPEK